MRKFGSKIKWFLPVILVLIFVFAEVGLLAALILGFTCFLLLWWFGRAKKPEGELPNASVSCCHYLGEDIED